MISVNGKIYKDTKNLRTCSCCGNLYLPGERFYDDKLSLEIAKDYTVDSKNYCSYGCLNESGYTISNYGNIVKFDGNNKILHKARYPLRIDNSTEKNPYCIGFEIEKEDPEIFSRIKKQGIKLPPGWLLMEDTSLKTGNGFELVTPAYNLEHKVEIKKHFSSFRRVLDSEYTNSCGGHISISKYGVDGKTLATEYKTLIAFFIVLYPNRLKNVNINPYNFKDLCEIEKKHKPIHYKGARLELRMISAVKSTKQLWRRLNTIEWFLINNPNLKDTILDMQSNTGFLKKLYKPIFGVERWPEIINRFEDVYNWFWDKNHSKDSAYHTKMNTYINRDLAE